MNAQDWLASASNTPDLVVIGAPISRASISPSEAWSTPTAFREALRRFPLWDAEHHNDIGRIRVRDVGDIASDRGDSDPAPAHRRIHEATKQWTASAPVVVIIGGDNSLTRHALQGLMEARPGNWGLVTLDAHHDVRPTDEGSNNGTPVRDLIEAGLPANRVAQVGIHPMGNSFSNSEWARLNGIHSHSLSEIRDAGVDRVVRQALGEVTGAGAEMLYADLDIDVVDRAFAPACPASMPGGLLPAEMCAAAYQLGSDQRVVAADLCEVDANADSHGITVRLMAQVFLSFCSGLATRRVSIE